MERERVDPGAVGVHPAYAALEHVREVGAAPGHREQDVAADVGRQLAAIRDQRHGCLRKALADPRQHRQRHVGQDADLALVGHDAFSPVRSSLAFGSLRAQDRLRSPRARACCGSWTC
jgi:hypothetical protein